MFAGGDEVIEQSGDFRSCTFRTLRDVRLESGMRTKADVRPPPLDLWIALASPTLFEIAVFHLGSACSPAWSAEPFETGARG